MKVCRGNVGINVSTDVEKKEPEGKGLHNIRLSQFLSCFIEAGAVAPDMFCSRKANFYAIHRQ